jgi:hypothetical protein
MIVDYGAGEVDAQGRADAGLQVEVRWIDAYGGEAD